MWDSSSTAPQPSSGSGPGFFFFGTGTANGSSGAADAAAAASSTENLSSSAAGFENLQDLPWKIMESVERLTGEICEFCFFFFFGTVPFVIVNGDKAGLTSGRR